MTKIADEVPNLQQDSSIRVVIEQEGPYLLYGSPIVQQQFIVPNANGESWRYVAGDRYAVSEDSAQPTPLCRCGASHNKPYCDNSHASTAWDSELTSPIDKILDDARIFEGEQLQMSDSERYCCYARFCHPGGGAWRLTQGSDNPASHDLAIREASMCPSARLMAWEVGSENPYEFKFEQSVGLLEDLAIDCSGGIWLRGGIAVARPDGEEYELRNRVVLCRCGASHNKPYCDGTHAAIKWRDNLPQNMEGEELPEGELMVEASTK